MSILFTYCKEIYRMTRKTIGGPLYIGEFSTQTGLFFPFFGRNISEQLFAYLDDRGCLMVMRRHKGDRSP